MGYHHTAFATRDIDATHAFYTEVMGFLLVRVVAAGTPEGGWAKHAFYDTGDGTLIAFWDLHDHTLPESWSPAISTGLGLPEWVNHLAFDAATLDDLATRRDHWVDAGHFVAEINHGWCTSIYTTDPNGILVEFCCTTAPVTEDDRVEARRMLAEPAPDLEEMGGVRFYGEASQGDPATAPEVVPTAT